MYICFHTHMYIYTYTHIYVYTHVYTYVCPEFPLNLNYMDEFPHRYNIWLSPSFPDLKWITKWVCSISPVDSQVRTWVNADSGLEIPVLFEIHGWPPFYRPGMCTGPASQSRCLETSDNCFRWPRLFKPQGKPVTAKKSANFLALERNSLPSKGFLSQSTFLINLFTTCQGTSCWG